MTLKRITLLLAVVFSGTVAPSVTQADPGGRCLHAVLDQVPALPQVCVRVYPQPCAGSASRSGKWVLDRLYSTTPTGWYFLINDWGAQCLNVAGNSRLDGADLIAYPCQPGAQNEMVHRIPAT